MRSFRWRLGASPSGSVQMIRSRKQDRGNSPFREVLTQEIVEIEMVELVETVEHDHKLPDSLGLPDQRELRKVITKVKCPVIGRSHEPGLDRFFRILRRRLEPF